MLSAEVLSSHVFSLKHLLMMAFNNLLKEKDSKNISVENILQSIKALTTLLSENNMLTEELGFILTQFSSTIANEFSLDKETMIMQQFNFALYYCIYPQDKGYLTYNLGNVALESGLSIPNAKIAYKTFGKLNDNKDNVIVYPTWYSGFFADNEWLIGKGMALDPDQYFIILVGALGNGLSSSPSNTSAPYNQSRFPHVSLCDNIHLQHRLITELWGIEKIKLVVGWSMGGQQSFAWGALYPDMVERIAPFCASSKTSPHNFVFLDSLHCAIQFNPEWKNGFYSENPTNAVRAFARIYAGWGFSQPFYRDEAWKKMGYASLEDFLVGFWEGFFLQRDANNLLAMIWTWQNADISNNSLYSGDLKKALSSIKAKAFVLAPEIDLYFPKEDNEWEVAQMPNAEYILMPGVWGHFAGGGRNPDDTRFLDNHLKRLLQM
jgi:homoserine O-acetyltransferase